MPFIEKTETVQYLDPGDDVTIDGARGTVLKSRFSKPRVDMVTNGGSMSQTYHGTDDTVLVFDEHGAHPYGLDFLQPGLDVMVEGVRGTLIDVVYSDVHVTLATDEGLQELALSGDTMAVYHNWYVPPDEDCLVCWEGKHHGPPATRCDCCGRTRDLWSINFIPDGVDN